MTDPRIDIDAEMQNPDLLLITDYLIGELDPAQVAAVKLRLKEDDAFREYCAPILLAWSVPPRHVRHPMPRVELEKHWDDFTRRAGFAHQRRRARKRWLTILGVALAVLTGSYFTFKSQVRAWYVDWHDYHAVAYAPGWVTIGEGREVQLSPGARLRVANAEDSNEILAVRLTGTARFRMVVTDSVALIPQTHFTTVATPSGYVSASIGELTVSARADTTELEIHHPSKRQYIGFMPLPSIVFLSDARDHSPLTVHEGERARVVKGSKPQITP